MMVKQNFKIFLLLSSVFFFGLTNSLMAQGEQSIFDQMNFQDVLDVQITTDFKTLFDRRNDKKQKATLSFVDGNGIAQTWDIKVKARGKFRRMRCTELPPLKIHFDKDDLREASLAKFNDLKLVNQCMEDEVVAKKLLLKEYLAYELYHKMTEESFRVQFLNITYIDDKTGGIIEQTGFFIEDAAQLRTRIGARKTTQERGFTAAQFDKEQFQLMALFQYWIGNSDWSVTFGRNIKVLEKDGSLIAIPYDFDFSGMVDAPYAIPNTDFGLTSVQERAYLGFEKDQVALQNTINAFVEMKPVLKKAVKKQKLLSWTSRNEIWTYLNGFFMNNDEINFGLTVERPVGRGIGSVSFGAMENKK